MRALSPWPRSCPGVRPTMRRAGILAVLIAAGCYEQASNRAVPVTFVNDACGANASQSACTAAAGCEWRPVKSDCPPGAACPDGVCATPNPCATLTDRALCEADARCAWAGLRAASQAIDLCPAGQTCDAGGYCHLRDASGGGCTCVQPVVCPANADCPAVQCDCSNPASGSGGGGGTCTCDCPACAPGETCSPCTCACGAGGACGSVTGDSGGRTCTCACPSCAPGATCPPCDCACGAGNVGVSNTAVSTSPTTVGPRNTGRSLRASRRRRQLRRGQRERVQMDRARDRLRDRALSDGQLRSAESRRRRRRVRVRVRGVRAGPELPAVRLRLLRSAGGPVPRSRPVLIVLRKRARQRARARFLLG